MPLTRRDFCIVAGGSILGSWASVAEAGTLNPFTFREVGKKSPVASPFVITANGDNRFQTGSGGTIKLRSNVNPIPRSVSHAVICVHGAERTYADHFRYITEAMSLAGAQALCIAPLFPEVSEVSSDLYWSTSGWSSGAIDESSHHYSSFSAMDDLVAALHADRITIVGHSGGGQFAHRYGLSTVSPGAMRFIAANPGSYTYLTPERPDLQSAGYVIPAVSGYDAYRYGLSSKLYPYLNQLTVTQLREQYIARRVIYLLGDADTDPNSLNLDVSQQAEVQGAQRFERGTRYFQYLNDKFAGHAHAKVIVPGVGHSARGMIESLPGRNAIFG